MMFNWNGPMLASTNLPSGGETGQVLTKASDADYDVAWTTPETAGVTIDEVHQRIETAINNLPPSVTIEDVNKAIQDAIENGSFPTDGKSVKITVAPTSTVFLSYWSVTLDGVAIVTGTRTFTKPIVELTMTCTSSWTNTNITNRGFNLYLNDTIVLSRFVEKNTGSIKAGESITTKIDISKYDDVSSFLNLRGQSDNL